MSGCVMVVDDEPDLLDLLRVLLEDEGYAPVCLPGAENVVEVSEQVHPQLFLLDLMLPQSNGIEVARQLREDGAPHIPMVAMSASSSMLDAASSSHLFEETLHKPFDLDRLLDTVDRYVDCGRSAGQ